jgi:hypothetical protein
MFSCCAFGAVLSVAAGVRLAMPSRSRRDASASTSSCFRLIPTTGVLRIVGVSPLTVTVSLTCEIAIDRSSCAIPPSGTFAVFSSGVMPLISTFRL